MSASEKKTKQKRGIVVVTGGDGLFRSGPKRASYLGTKRRMKFYRGLARILAALPADLANEAEPYRAVWKSLESPPHE